MRAILARHGESEFSVRGAMNGDVSVPCGLTPAGVAQARRLGELLEGEPIDICVTSEFERAQATAEEALRGRSVPRIVVPELNDPRYGRYEGAQLDDYRSWALGAASSDVPGPGGESRRMLIDRYARAFRILLARPEETVLVVAHSLPISYALTSRDGIEPARQAPVTAYATPFLFSAEELGRAAGVLERWLAAPSW